MVDFAGSALDGNPTACLAGAVGGPRRPTPACGRGRVRPSRHRHLAGRDLRTQPRHRLADPDDAGARGHGRGDRETGQYAIGLGLVELARSAGVDALAASAHAVLERLSLQTGETAALAVVRGGGLTYVDEVAPGLIVSAVGWRGRSVPLHATSTGKVLLAFSDPDRRRPDVGPDACGAGPTTTITDREALLLELASRRSAAAATPCAVASSRSRRTACPRPVLDAARRPVAVLSVWGPRDRVNEARASTRWARWSATPRHGGSPPALTAQRGLTTTGAGQVQDDPPCLGSGGF